MRKKNRNLLYFIFGLFLSSIAFDLMNTPSIFVTFSVRHCPMGWLNDSALLNIESMVATFSVCHCPMGWLNKNAHAAAASMMCRLLHALLGFSFCGVSEWLILVSDYCCAGFAVPRHPRVVGVVPHLRGRPHAQKSQTTNARTASPSVHHGTDPHGHNQVPQHHGHDRQQRQRAAAAFESTARGATAAEKSHTLTMP